MPTASPSIPSPKTSAPPLNLFSPLASSPPLSLASSYCRSSILRQLHCRYIISSRFSCPSPYHAVVRPFCGDCIAAISSLPGSRAPRLIILSFVHFAAIVLPLYHLFPVLVPLASSYCRSFILRQLHCRYIISFRFSCPSPHHTVVRSFCGNCIAAISSLPGSRAPRLIMLSFVHFAAIALPLYHLFPVLVPLALSCCRSFILR